jgi:L-aminopeptidase/D-esterase-like protein
MCPDGAVAAVDVRGGAPGTRETDLLGAGRLVQRVNAVMLSGGSAFGLAAAEGVVRLLAERGSGFAVGGVRVPIVPAAVIFDLGLGSDRAYPDAELGYRSALGATRDGCEEGCVGAGTGASVGKVLGIAQATKSGLGTSAIRLADGVTVGALVVVNALGDVVNPRTGQIVAGSRDPSTGEFVSAVAVLLRGRQGQDPESLSGQNTTIGVVATDGALTRDDLQRVAALAHDGLARVVRPAHTAYDGDTFFALATGQAGVAGDATAIAVAAGEVVATAVVRAVLAATSLANLPAASDRLGMA